MEAMSKKEKLARGSAVVKVMRVSPRAGHYLNSYVDVHKMPRAVKPIRPGVPMALLEMPHLDTKEANFDMKTRSARISIPFKNSTGKTSLPKDPCMTVSEEIPKFTNDAGVPEKHSFLEWFSYSDWAKIVYPPQDANLAEHFNILLGLLISMSKDPDNKNFPDSEAYPCIQFLRTVKSGDSKTPTNIASLINYIEFICAMIIEQE